MYHTVIIVGNLGGDPEMRFTPQGQAVTSFSVAANHKYTSAAGESVTETVWFRISAWGKLGEICNEFGRKGSRVLVEGKLKPDPATGNPRIWQQKNGEYKSGFDITAATVRFLTKTNEVEREEARLPVEADIPF